MDLAIMKAANERRDASTFAFFEEVLNRMLEAEQELILALQADNSAKATAARERVSRHKGAILDAYKHALASNSNMLLKILELKALEPPALPIICAGCKKPIKPDLLLGSTCDCVNRS